MSTIVLKALPGKLDIKRHSPSILYISSSLTMSIIVLKALLVNLVSKDTHIVFSIYFASSGQHIVVSFVPFEGKLKESPLLNLNPFYMEIAASK